MKRLTTIIALALCLIVSGVYATWYFVSGVVNTVDRYVELTPKLDTVTTTSAPGAYKVELKNFNFEGNADAQFVIDQKGGEITDPNYHKAVLEIPEDAEIVITFTPEAGASVDVKNNAVPTYFYFTAPESMKFTADASTGLYSATAAARPIFTITPDEADKELIDWEKDDATGVFSYTLDATHIAQHIQLNHFVIDTMGVYNLFRDALAGTITLHVTDNVQETVTGGTEVVG